MTIVMTIVLIFRCNTNYFSREAAACPSILDIKAPLAIKIEIVVDRGQTSG
tara:strand:+ start:514 stop:666 length:153 start_codon:yes stop_codon:yes gene_type:complete